MILGKSLQWICALPYPIAGLVAHTMIIIIMVKSNQLKRKTKSIERQTERVAINKINIHTDTDLPKFAQAGGLSTKHTCKLWILQCL